MKYIVPKAYRVPKAPKNTVQNDKIINSCSQNNPRPLAEGVGEGSQHLHEGVCAQGLSRVKYNEMKKSAEADFYLNVPQSGTYRIEDISCETYRAEGISRAEGTKKRCSER
jgi:hypothetical protein